MNNNSQENARLQRVVRREAFAYLVVGGCTSLIGMGGYWLLLWLGLDPVPSNVLSWCFAVAFAYVANKLAVFRDHERAPAAVLRQIVMFVSARLFSLGAETLLIWLGTEKLGINEYLVKLPVAVVVVALNYVTGKFFVFIKKR